MPCKHERLAFGSGGFYVFCTVPGCGASWVARKAENDEIDYARSEDGLTIGDRREKPIDQNVPTLFYSDSPTVTFTKLPDGKIKLRSNSIDGEKVVPAGRGLLLTCGPQGMEAINPEQRTAQFPRMAVTRNGST